MKKKVIPAVIAAVAGAAAIAAVVFQKTKPNN